MHSPGASNLLKTHKEDKSRKEFQLQSVAAIDEIDNYYDKSDLKTIGSAIVSTVQASKTDEIEFCRIW